MWLAALGCVEAPPAEAVPGALPAVDVDDVFADDAGLVGRYRLIAAPSSAPRGVLLVFPADYLGATYALDAERRADLAAAHGLAVVGLQNPDWPPGNSCWWTPAVVEYASWVDALLSTVLIPTYGVSPDRVFLTGLSGGADFATAFAYHSGFRYRGGSVALCGGDVPRLDGGDCAAQEDPPPAPPVDASASARAGVRYDFAITANDSLAPYAEAAAAFYRDAGFEHVTYRVVEGDGHCGFADGFDGLDELADGLERVAPE